MPQVETGDTVKVHCTGKLLKLTVFVFRHGLTPINTVGYLFIKNSLMSIYDLKSVSLSKLDDGTTFMTSVGREPVQLTIGRDNILAEVEEAIIGMNTGESKSIKIPAESAYGPYQQDLCQTVNRSKIRLGLEPEIGQKLKMTQEGGQEMLVTVTGLSESSITLDANHSLAGQDLTFDIELVEIA